MGAHGTVRRAILLGAILLLLPGGAPAEAPPCESEVMQLRFLFWHLSASRIIFLTLVFSLGLILGFLWGRRPRRRS